MNRSVLTMNETVRIWRAAVWIAALALVVNVCGCRIKIDRDIQGHDKNVQFDMPFAHLKVNTDQTAAADIGLPLYPGAQVVEDRNHEKSANVSLGFAGWQLRVKAVTYQTPDAPEKVVAFYKQALGHYGTVITCRGESAVGEPHATAEGLTCDDENYRHRIHITTGEGRNGMNIDAGSDKEGVELRTGSRHHQHIVGFEGSSDGKTHFSLVALDLPSGSSKRNRKVE